MTEPATNSLPEDAGNQFNFALALWQQSRLEEAEAAAKKAAALRPNDPQIYFLLGMILRRMGRPAEAVAANLKVLELRPNSPEALNNLGNAWRDLGKAQEAIAAFRRALVLLPDSPQVLNNLGCVLLPQGMLEEAEATLRRALVVRPDYLEAACNLGCVLYATGDWDQAMAIQDEVLKRRPDYVQAHWERSMILLGRGQYESGWSEYEWRWKNPDPRLGIRLQTPRWDGTALNGRTIVLHTEQGLGDAIQFCRFIPLVAERGGKIVLVCRRELLPLLRKLSGLHACFAEDEATPPHDVHCPIGSLPLVLGITLENLPARVPYLWPDEERIPQWRQRMAEKPGRKIGLAWAGRPGHPNDLQRSFGLSALAPLGEVSGVTYFSLQKGEAAAQTASAPFEVTDWTDEIKDFADTAGMIANLDLVISADTVVAHLAGAMGKPVWVLLPLVPDWRWMLGRQDCPWYPAMRLFRQSRRGDWQSPVRTIVEALRPA
jgi:Flp pilus assembly protein TadD